MQWRLRIKTRFLLHITYHVTLSFQSRLLTLSLINAQFIKQRSHSFFKKATKNKFGKQIDGFFSFQNPISSGKISKDFYNIPQMARANSRVQHINIQQDESIFISWNLIIYQKKERTKRDIEEIKPMYRENKKWIIVSYILERQQKWE